ncbi:hypothetical protein O9993_00550 [Vibrio lentus]|nr:hypothetical protein [Vibrio lentus]
MSRHLCSLVLEAIGGNTAHVVPSAFNRGLESVTNKYGQIAGFLVKRVFLLFTFFVVNASNMITPLRKPRLRHFGHLKKIKVFLTGLTCNFLTQHRCLVQKM